MTSAGRVVPTHVVPPHALQTVCIDPGAESWRYKALFSWRQIYRKTLISRSDKVMR